MVAYAYILDLFKNVLSQSKAIKGRVYYAPFLGAELNTDNLNETVKDLVKKDAKTKYPLALILPPTSQGSSASGMFGGFESYNITMFFLKQSYVTGSGLTQDRNPNTNTSKHEIYHDWHDMKRVSKNFLETLKSVLDKNRLTNIRVYLDKAVTTPVTFAGEDRASGVQIRFELSLFNGCVIEDYETDALTKITLPALDSHPEHKL